MAKKKPLSELTLEEADSYLEAVSLTRGITHTVCACSKRQSILGSVYPTNPCVILSVSNIERTVNKKVCLIASAIIHEKYSKVYYILPSILSNAQSFWL